MGGLILARNIVSLYLFVNWILTAQFNVLSEPLVLGKLIVHAWWVEFAGEVITCTVACKGRAPIARNNSKGSRK
jgi:hypothetical protein